MENPNPNLPEEAELSTTESLRSRISLRPQKLSKQEAALTASRCKTGCKLSARLSGKSISAKKLQLQAARLCLFQKGVSNVLLFC